MPYLLTRVSCNDGNKVNRRSEMMSSSQPVTRRWNPTREQLRILEHLYNNIGIHTPTTEQIHCITTHLRLYGKIGGMNVFYWFKNHKARESRKKKRCIEEARTLKQITPSSSPSSSLCSTETPPNGDQAICGTNNKSYDGDPGSNLTDENDAIGITHAEYENILEVFQEIEDNVLNKPDSSACKVLHMASDSIESEELSGKGISNIEGLSANSEFGNRADNQKQLEIIDVDLVSACPQKAEEIATSKDNAQCVEQLGECFLCQELRETSCKKKGSGSIGSLEASLDTMDSSQGLPQACGTHIWFDEDGNVMDKHSLQSVATQVHSQEIENYIESGEETTFADASTSEVLSVGDVLPIRGQEKKKRSRNQISALQGQRSEATSSSADVSMTKLPDASELLVSVAVPFNEMGTDHSSRVAAAMAASASRKRPESNGSVILLPHRKLPRGNLPHSRIPPDTSGGLLIPPQLTGRSNVATEDVEKLFVRRKRPEDQNDAPSVISR